jgi:hypothetical protein
MISIAVIGSRFQVGSSHIIISGSLTNALAIATLCFSHHDNSNTNLSFFISNHTCSRASGTFFLITLSLYQQTSIANATFSYTFFEASSL